MGWGPLHPSRGVHTSFNWLLPHPQAWSPARGLPEWSQLKLCKMPECSNGRGLWLSRILRPHFTEKTSETPRGELQGAPWAPPHASPAKPQENTVRQRAGYTGAPSPLRGWEVLGCKMEFWENTPSTALAQGGPQSNWLGWSVERSGVKGTVYTPLPLTPVPTRSQVTQEERGGNKRHVGREAGRKDTSSRTSGGAWAAHNDPTATTGPGGQLDGGAEASRAAGVGGKGLSPAVLKEGTGPPELF